MKIPNDINGIRTESIMKNINREMYDNGMAAVEYNQMFMIIYESLKKISIKNLHRCLGEMGVNLFDDFSN